MFENVVSSNSLERVDAHFQRMAEVGRLTPEMIAQSEEYANAITQEGLSAEEASEHYYAMAEAKQTAANTPQPDIDFSDFEDAPVYISSSDKLLLSGSMKYIINSGLRPLTI